MTDLMHYEKGCSPSAIQRKYSLTYVQGYELAESLKKTQELELEVRRENAQLKELLKECREHFITYKRDDIDKGYVVYDGSYLIAKINQELGEPK
jgi:hypothetical protein